MMGRSVWVGAVASLLVAGCPCSTGDAPDQYGAYCDSGTPDECPSDMECVRLNMHTSHYSPTISAQFACAIPCASDCDCPIQTCGGGVESGPSNAPYRCAEDGFCYVEWCSEPEHL